MRHVIASLLVAGSVCPAAIAFQGRTGGPARGEACALLTRDLAMQVSTPEGRKRLEGTRPSSDSAGMSVAKGSSVCNHGDITLVLEQSERAGEIRMQMRARTSIYKDYEPVPGVGDEAFFWSNRTFAYLYVWSGSRHFMVEMGPDLGGGAQTLKPNVITLAKTIVPQLR